MTAAFAIRAGRPADHPFVFARWVRSYEGSRWADAMPLPLFQEGHHRLIAALLAREGVRLLVACDPQDENTILGWAVLEPGVLHYVFVKEGVRRLGIGTALIASLSRPFRYSHQTDDFATWRRLHLYDFTRWDPYAAFVARIP